MTRLPPESRLTTWSEAGQFLRKTLCCFESAAGARALLVLLPVVLLAANSQWLWSPPSRDFWLYYGYFQNGVDYLRRFPDFYYGSRLSVIVPGWVLHHLLPPAAANVVLHLCLYWLAILSFFSAARSLYGHRAALLASVILGSQTFFLVAMGRNYVDGFGIAYFLLALALLLGGGQQPNAWRLALAGTAAVAMVAANLVYAVYLAPLALVLALRVRRLPRDVSVRLIAWCGLGAMAALAALCAVSRLAGGPWWFLGASIRYALAASVTANPFRSADYLWLRGAQHLAFPATMALAASIALVQSTRSAQRLPNSRLAPSLLLAVASGLIWAQVFGDSPLLQFAYYSSFLAPLAALTLTAMLARASAQLTEPLFGLTVGVAMALAWAALGVRLDAAALVPQPRVLWPLLAGLPVVALLVWPRPRWWAVVSVLGWLSLQSALVREIPRHFYGVGELNGRAGALFLQMDRAIALIDDRDPQRRMRLWYDLAEQPHGRVYDAIACAFLLGPRVGATTFPEWPRAVSLDGEPLRPGQLVVVLAANRDDVPARATEAMSKLGFGCRILEQRTVSGPVEGLVLTFFEVTATATVAGTG